MDNIIGVPSQILTQPQVDLLYDILRRWDSVAYKSGFHYSIACGTALGAVLRGGLIPWDSDADLFVRDDEFTAKLPEIVRNATGQLIIKKYTARSDGRGWYKLHHPVTDSPNVDIYLMEYIPKENVWRPSDPAVKLRREILLDCDQIASRSTIMFGPLRLPIFVHPERFLDRCYGQWRSVGSKDGSVHTNFVDTRPSLPT